jgi:hypothetical protein
MGNPSQPSLDSLARASCRQARGGINMLIERTKTKRKESLLTFLGFGLDGLGAFISKIADSLVYETIEKEVKP